MISHTILTTVSPQKTSIHNATYATTDTFPKSQSQSRWIDDSARGLPTITEIYQIVTNVNLEINNLGAVAVIIIN